MKENLKSLGKLLWNKGVALVALGLVITRYLSLGESTPFAELLYALVLVSSIIVVAPVVRLLVFPSAARYAEQGLLKADLEQPLDTTPALKHYWFCTGVSYAVVVLCFKSLLGF
tara:strand:+ start:669 stop:1010 length:342 start_codon:yes stop_codon:yes gene_type:complete